MDPRIARIFSRDGHPSRVPSEEMVVQLHAYVLRVVQRTLATGMGPRVVLQFAAICRETGSGGSADGSTINRRLADAITSELCSRMLRSSNAALSTLRATHTWRMDQSG